MHIVSYAYSVLTTLNAWVSPDNEILQGILKISYIELLMFQGRYLLQLLLGYTLSVFWNEPNRQYGDACIKKRDEIIFCVACIFLLYLNWFD